MNLKHQFNDKGKELTFDLDYVHYGGKKKSDLDTRYFKADGTPDEAATEMVRNDMPSDINIAMAKLDYTQTIGQRQVRNRFEIELCDFG